jgi:hypothetical protein
MSELDPEPADSTDVSFIMQFGLHEKGKQYSFEEARALYKKGRDAGLERDHSREDEEELADVQARYSRWEIARDTKDLEENLKKLEKPYDADFAKIYAESAQREDENILYAYAHVLAQYRSLEWSAVYDNREVTPAVKLKLVDAEANYKKALQEFDSRSQLYEPYGKSRAETLADVGVTSVAEHREELDKMRKEHAERKRWTEEQAHKGKGCGCLVVVAPLVGMALYGGLKLLG